MRVIAPSSLFASQAQPQAKLTYHEFDHQDQKVNEILIRIKQFPLQKLHLQISLAT